VTRTCVQYGAAESVSRQWTDEGKNVIAPIITQKVFLYNSTFTAAFHYWISRPEFAYSNDWPNFSNPNHKSQKYPHGDYYSSEFANQDSVVCAMGGPSSCQMWFYWARYGKYLLSVYYFGPNQGMDIELFSRVVTEIDSYVASQLQY